MPVKLGDIAKRLSLSVRDFLVFYTDLLEHEGIEISSKPEETMIPDELTAFILRV